MDQYDEFEATHRIVATRGEGVTECKRTVISNLCDLATELRVVVHSTVREGVPEAATELDAVAPDRAAFGDDVTEREGRFPDAERVVDAVLAEMDDDGGLPVTALGFAGNGFEAVVTASTSHSHVGKFDCDDPGLLDDFSDAVAEVGAVVPDGPSIGWERGGTYFELDGPDLCVYAERPASAEERPFTTHSCHDLTRLTGVSADETRNRIALSWRDSNSLWERAIQALFGRPPAELVVPGDDFDAVEAYLGHFLPESDSSVEP